MGLSAFVTEIEQLHQFFVAWFTGQIAKEEQHFARFEKNIVTEFGLVGPDGILIEREVLVPALRDAHGSRSGEDFRIWIQNPHVRWQEGDLTLVTYEEWQYVDGQDTARLSTAIFRECSDTPNGIEWVHVHETWLDAK